MNLFFPPDRSARQKRILTAAVLLALAAGFFYMFHARTFLLRSAAEAVITAGSREFLEGPVRLKRVSVDRRARIAVEELEGNLKTKKEPVPVKVNRIVSENSLLNYLFGKPVRYRFEGARPASSRYRGLEGLAVSQLGKSGVFELSASIREMDLGDITWMNPENLRGSSGRMVGSLFVRVGPEITPVFRMELTVHEPGGKLQAQFFDILVPLLPQYEAIGKLRALAGSLRLVGYSNAEVRAELAENDRLKIFFHILIPDYNLNLNVNLEVRTDEKNAFFKLAQILGLIEVRGS